MASASLSFLLSNRFQWQWNSNVETKSIHNDQWQMYTDIDNDIIEHAYNRKQTEVELDEGRFINLQNMLQYNKLDKSKHYSIKRIQVDRRRRSDYSKEERFAAVIPLYIPSPSSSSTHRSLTMLSVMRHCSDISKIYKYSQDSSWNKPVSDILKETIEGMIKEGITHRKEKNAQQLAGYIEFVQEYAEDLVPYEIIPAEIGDMLGHIFTRDSFWFKLINQITQDLKYIQSDRVKTIGPFCYLLHEYLKWNITMPDCSIVYRGVNLTDEQRLNFMKSNIHFSSFTSTSKNRNVADIFGNTLLIIELNQPTTRCGSDISMISNFPDEEEFLILPGSIFDFVKYEYDQSKNKHIHYLKESLRNTEYS